MQWQEIRKHYPEQWLLVEAIEAHSAAGKRILKQLAVIDTFPDSATALKRYAQLHRAMPAREYYVFHSSREKLEVIESTLTDNNKGQAQIKPAQVAEVMSDLTTQERQALYRRQPLAAYLLTALTRFHAVEVRTAQPLILAYAAKHYCRDHHLFSRWQAWWRNQTLRRILTYLLNFDVNVKNGLIVAPDALLDSADVDDARRRVGDFLVAYRWPFHNRLLRRFHRHAEAQRWTLFDLALQHQEGQEHARSEQLYTVAISVSPHHWCYNNRGSARQAQGGLAAAIADYRKALEKAEMLPDQGLRAYRSLGAALREQAKWQEALIIYRQALTLDDNRLSDWIELADVARHAGDEQTWQEALAQARRRLPADDAYNRACLESVAGNVEEALAALAQAAQADDFDPAWAHQDPDLAWVQADSRFAEIVGKIIDTKDISADKLEQAEGERQVTVAETKSASKV